MTADLRGLDLLDAAIDHIEKHPETWNQRSYRCATGMCLAGWIAVLAGGQWATPPMTLPGHHLEHGECLTAEPDDPAAVVADWGCETPHIHVAERLIDVSRYVDNTGDDHERDLFDGMNDLDEIKAMRDDLRAGAA